MKRCRPPCIPLVVALLLLVARPAHAYIDPNTFHSIFGSLWPFLAAGIAALGILIWPLRWVLARLWSWAKKRRTVAAIARSVRAHPRRAFLVSIGAALGGLAFGVWHFALRGKRRPRIRADGSRPRVILLGVDGLDPSIVEAMMSHGELANFRRLSDLGGFARLATSNPAHSPNAWTCIATGGDAGQHGVFDFILRDPATYRLDLAVLRRNASNLLGQRDSMFLPVRRCPAFWELLSEAGVPATVVRWPVTFPPDAVTGCSLSGLGVPDIKGGLGAYTFYTTRQASPNEEGREKVVVVEQAGNAFETAIQGPAVAGLSGTAQASIPLKIMLRPDGRGVSLLVGRDAFDVDVGQWSGHVRLRFDAGLSGSITGMAAFYLKSVRPHLELYLSPIEVHPLDPAFPISSPSDYARELAEAIGPFHTLGIPEDTNAVTEGRLDADAFLHLCHQINAERERMLLHELGRFDDGLLAFVADTSDRLQHMFWVRRDPGHPLYDPAFAKRYAEVIPDVYRHADKLLGHVLECADGKATVLVVSDHGFAPFRRAVHLNSWLAANGFMFLKTAPSDPEGGALFQNVVWEETSAYALGFGGIYVNLRGREGRGAVAQGSECRTVCERIASGLQAVRDPKTGQCPVRRVYLRDELYHGPQAAQGPDLVVGFEPGYRASWQTALGGAPQGILDDNRKLWSGDHIVDPSCVPGVLLANRPLKGTGLSQTDVAPTVLGAFGVQKTPAMNGDAFL